MGVDESRNALPSATLQIERAAATQSPTSPELPRCASAAYRLNARNTAEHVHRVDVDLNIPGHADDSLGVPASATTSTGPRLICIATIAAPTHHFHLNH